MKSINLEIKPITDFKTSEAYKSIRTNIAFCGDDIKTIAFTSCFANEGKTTVSWNLAMSMAENEKKVLFIDADMRKSVFSGRYKIREKTVGISHFLSGQAELDDIVYATPVANLYYAPTGIFPPGPSELLSKPIFKEMLDVFKDSFDYIIIDTPPILLTVDPKIIASVCDGCILVIDSDATPRKATLEAVENLKNTGTTIIGTVLNKMETRTINVKYYRYYRKYYKYDYEYEYKEKEDDNE